MKAMLVLYGIPQFIEVPLPPPMEIKLVVADPAIAAAAEQCPDEIRENIITFRKTGVYIDADVPKAVIYQAI